MKILNLQNTNFASSLFMDFAYIAINKFFLSLYVFFCIILLNFNGMKRIFLCFCYICFFLIIIFQF